MPDPKSPRERYMIEVEMLPGQVPGDARLKRLLKLMLRSFGAKVVSVLPSPPPTPPEGPAA